MYLCVDIGGTKTIVALVDSKGKLLHSVKFLTNNNQTKFYEALTQQIRVNFVMSSIKAISVAMPGLVKHNRAIWLGNLPWHDMDIAKMLKADFGLPVYVENDANLAALAEARSAKGRSLYFTFSTACPNGIQTLSPDTSNLSTTAKNPNGKILPPLAQSMPNTTSSSTTSPTPPTGVKSSTVCF